MESPDILISIDYAVRSASGSVSDSQRFLGEAWLGVMNEAQVCKGTE